MSRLAEVFGVLESLKSEGTIVDYAIGGAMAVLFYAEPLRTYDLDVFVFLPEQSGGLVSLTPLYQHLAARGFRAEAEHVMIHEVPVRVDLRADFYPTRRGARTGSVFGDRLMTVRGDHACRSKQRVVVFDRADLTVDVGSREDKPGREIVGRGRCKRDRGGLRCLNRNSIRRAKVRKRFPPSSIDPF